jgi:polyhydroxyalkanoate synthesis regulator phasin
MQELQRIEHDILAQGEVDSDHLEAIHRRLYATGKITRAEADFLVDLHKRVQHSNPSFEYIFYRAIQDHLLADGRIDAEKVSWLRHMLFADGKIKDEEKKFLQELKGEAQEVSKEFEALFDEAMKMPQERRTSGSKQ